MKLKLIDEIMSSHLYTLSIDTTLYAKSFFEICIKKDYIIRVEHNIITIEVF